MKHGVQFGIKLQITLLTNFLAILVIIETAKDTSLNEFATSYWLLSVEIGLVIFVIL